MEEIKGEVEERKGEEDIEIEEEETEGKRCRGQR
jgi:hypothetical protein